MPILDQLSSKQTPRSGDANREAAKLCIHEPGLLLEIAAGLPSKDPNLAGDCAEVMTMVAEKHPELVAPYAQSLAVLLDHKKTRVRWEAMHALAYGADRVPRLIESLLPRLYEIISADESVIVRDYAVDALSRYASLGSSESQKAYPILKIACSAWEGKHAGHALAGLKHVALNEAAPMPELSALAGQGLADMRGVVKKAGSDLFKAVAKVVGK